MTGQRSVHYVEHVVTGKPACGIPLGLSDTATSTTAAVTCLGCRTVLDVVGVCTSCGLTRDHAAVTHRPHGHAVWCLWTACGHHISRGDTACPEQHHESPEKGTPPMSDQTPPDDTGPETPAADPPAKKTAKRAPRKAPEPPPADKQPDGPLTPEQEARVAALHAARAVLTERPGAFSSKPGAAADLLDVAEFILTGLRPVLGGPIDVDEPDDGGPGLSWSGPPATSNPAPITIHEGAAQ